MSFHRSRSQGGPTRRRRARGSHRNRVNRSKQRHRLIPAIQVLEARHLLAFTTELLLDINQFGVSSAPDSLIEFNNEVYFVANDGLTGSELWKSDGTPSGTVLIADINPGASGSLPSNLAVFGNDLYFTALDGDDEFDIWKTDGTTSGTVRVFDADAAGVYEISQLTPSGNRLFFTAYESSSGYELWATDGTAAGTALVLDINPDQTVGEGPLELTDVNGTLYFSSYGNGYDNRELWKSDGTAIGTMLVANVDGDPIDSSSPHNLTNLNGTLYFAADHPATGVELYKSGGTGPTTVRVTDLNSGSNSSYPESLTPFQGQLFFTANDGVTGRQLFKTDGTSVTLVANTSPGGTGSSTPTELTVVGNELFFVANGGSVPGPVVATAPALSSNNSFRGGSTSFVGLVGATTGPYTGIVSAATAAGSFTMTQQSGTTSDGPGWVGQNARIGDVGVGLSGVQEGDFILQTFSNTRLSNPTWEWTIEDPQGLSGIDFSGFVSGNQFDEASEAILLEFFLNGSATRTSFQEISGDQLDNWLTDRDANNISLTHAGGPSITSATVRMRFQPDGGSTQTPDGTYEAIVMRASLAATGQSSGVAGRELHKTDGTTTTLVKDIVTSGSSGPAELTEVDGKLLFTANDPLLSGRELWVSDGTSGGTVLVKDIRSGFDLYGAPLSGNPRDLTNINGTLFFSVSDDLNDREIWTSNGTSAGTNLLKNINIGTQDANVQQVVEVGTKLFFVADDGINGEAVWVADSVARTITLAADVTASPNDRINGLAKFGNGVIFHNDSLGVYTTDGTTTTALVAATPLPFNDRGDLFLEAGSLAYFVRSDATNGEELWKTNGTSGGTSIVTNLANGSSSSQPRELVAFQNRVYFSAASIGSSGEMTGRELFRSDGTAVGTQLVADINFDEDPAQPGAPITLSSDPQNLTVSGNLLYFSANGGVNNGNAGRELWVSNGNLFSATLVSDIRAGTNSSDPTNLTDVNGVLYFSANNGSNGFEPFRSQGTSVTTSLVADINSGTASSFPNHFMGVGSAVYFAAFELTTGTELYVTDGTPAGTSIISDLQSGVASSNPVPLGAVSGDRLLVAATDNGTVDREIWITGGPISSLVQALDMYPGELFGSNPSDLIPDGSSYVIVGNDGLSGRELYQLWEVAPTVESVVIDDGTVQRSSIGQVQVTFDSEVDLLDDPFEFVNLTTTQALVDVASVIVDQGKTIVTFTFLQGDSVNAAGLLLNGNYQLTIDASKVASFSTPLDGDGDGNGGDNFVFGASAVDKFYRKFGDANGNGIVDLLDFSGFRRAYGSNPALPNWNHAFDEDGNGSVGLIDFSGFRRNYGT